MSLKVERKEPDPIGRFVLTGASKARHLKTAEMSSRWVVCITLSGELIAWL